MAVGQADAVFVAKDQMSPALQRIVGQLDRVAGATDKVNKRHAESTSATKRLGGAYRSQRAAMQNFSFQIQDIAVQLSMGQNAALVFAQQFPQLVSGFGFVGAAAGAVVAVLAGVGMAITGVSGNSRTLTQRLTESSEAMNDFSAAMESTRQPITDFGGLISEQAVARLERFQNITREIAKADLINELFGNISFDTRGIVEKGLTSLTSSSFLAPPALKKYSDATVVALRAMGDQFGFSEEQANDFIVLLGRFRDSRKAEDAAALLNFIGENADDTAKELEEVSGVMNILRGFINETTQSKQKLLAQTEKDVAAAEREAQAYLESTNALFKYNNELKRIADLEKSDLEKGPADTLRRKALDEYAESLRSSEEARARAEKDAERQAQQRLRREAQITNSLNKLESDYWSFIGKIRNDKAREEEIARQKAEQADANTMFSMLQRAQRARQENDKYIESLQAQGRAYEESINPALRYQRTIDELNIALTKDLDEHTYNLLAEQAKSSYEAAMLAADEYGQKVKQLQDRITTGFENSFASFIKGTQSAEDAFRSFASTIIDELIRITIRENISGALSGLFGSVAGGLLGLASSSDPQVTTSSGMFDFPRKGLAAGGPVASGKSYLVGEEGPEIFKPAVSGTIIPNDRMGGGEGITVNQTIQISTGVAQTVRAEIMNLMPAITQATKQAVADSKQRGGQFGRVFAGA